MALAGEECTRLAHQFVIIGRRNLAGAGPRAALDLEQQARPGPAFEYSVRAGADQERALQGGDGAVHRPDRGERSVIVAGAGAGAAMFQDLRGGMFLANDNIGKRLVIAHQHVEARAQALDQVCLEQQRLGLGAGRDEFHRRGQRDHAADALVVPGRPRIGRDALFDVVGLADIEHVAGCIEHSIDAGRRRRLFQMPKNDIASGRQRARWHGFAFALGKRQTLILVLFGEFELGLDIGFSAIHGVELNCRRARMDATGWIRVRPRAMPARSGVSPLQYSQRIVKTKGRAFTSR